MTAPDPSSESPAWREFTPRPGQAWRLLARVRVGDSLQGQALARALERPDRQLAGATGELMVRQKSVPPSPDTWLQRLASDLEQFNRASGAAAAEIVETSRQAVGGTAAADSRLSRRFRIVSKPEEAGPDALVLVHAPGVFGSGLHPSTRLAARALEELVGPEDDFPERVLDVGTGSGVLALVAGRLSAREVLGLDVCSQALAAARRNVAANGLAARVAVAATPLSQVAGRFELVVSNLTPAVLRGVRPALLERLAPGGRLILSGLQGGQFERAAGPLLEAGLLLEKRYQDGEWRAGRFLKMKN